MLLQEYTFGPDDHHYSTHLYMDRDGVPLACFTGRKVRIYPAFAGSGCYVQSVYAPELIEISLQILRSINYTGVAVLNFKRDSRTGEFQLHEINPRISQWNILATACGVDVPFAAYAEAAGIPCSAMLRQRVDLQYVDLRNDLKSLRQYQKAGQWNLAVYVASLLRQRTIHQLWSLDDPMPLLYCLGRYLGRFLSPRRDTHVPVASSSARNTGGLTPELFSESTVYRRRSEVVPDLASEQGREEKEA